MERTVEATVIPEPVVTSQVSTRLYFVDYLRVALTMLVIVHHLAVTYSVVALWYYVEPPNDETVSLILGLLVLINQGYFMGLFFLISGYFTPGSYERKGARAFLWDRVVRLGIPILLFIFVLGPISMLPAFAYTNSIAAPGETLSYWQFYFVSLGPGPLWFLEALLLWNVAYVGWRWLTRGNAPRNEAAAIVDHAAPSFLTILLFTFALAVITFVWRIWVPLGLTIPVVAFPSASHIPQYVALFIVGVLAYRRNWLMSVPDVAGRIGFAAAGIATLGMVVFAAMDVPGFLTQFMGGVHLTGAVYASWEAILCVGMTLGLLTSFRHHFNKQSALGRFLSEQAYAVYIIHAPVIVGVAYAMQNWQLAPLLKFVVACAISIPLCFVIAAGVRRLPGLRRVL